MSEEGIITYDKLYEVLRLEKYKKELQKLDIDFYNKVVKYLDEKNSILQSQEGKDSVFASQSIAKTKRQLENTRMILKELYEKREGKIIQSALFSSRTGEKSQETDAMLDDEFKFYTALVALFDNYKNGILLNILQGKLPQIKESITNIENKISEKTNRLVRFLNAVPQFVGNDMNTYGPFDTEDVANLPEKVSEILIKNNRAEEI